jgi:hypothetical protein
LGCGNTTSLQWIKNLFYEPPKLLRIMPQLIWG